MNILYCILPIISGMSIASTKELAFLDWLRRHGAVLDKLEWPAVDPATGSRGAIALTDIEVPFLMSYHSFHTSHVLCYYP
jgi:hypothetical protein